MKKLLLVSLMVILAVGLILGGCAKKTTTTTTQTQTSTTTKTTTTTTAPHKVLKIGSVMAMGIPTNVEVKKWYQLFAKLINEQGGWKIGADTYDVQIIVYDGENDPAKSKNYLEKLVLQDGAKFILGTPTSNPASDAEITEPNKVLCFGIDAIGNSADPKLQYYYTPGGITFGRGAYYIWDQGAAALGGKTWASLKTDDILGQMTDAWGKATWAVAVPNMEYVGTVFFTPTTVDFGPIATKLMTLNPDVIDANFTYPNSGPYNALYDAGYKGTVEASMDLTTLNAIITHTGNEFVEEWQALLQDPYMIPNQDPGILALCDAYTKEYGTFIPDGCGWIDQWFVLKDAINATQSLDTDVIKAYLDKTDHGVRTMLGYSQLLARPDMNNLRTVSGAPSNYMAVVKDGKYVALKPVSSKDNYLASILSYGVGDVFKAYWAQYGYPKFPADQTSTLKYSDLGITGQD